MSQVVCSSCRSLNRLGAKFCGKCGGLLPSQVQPTTWGGYPVGSRTGMLPTNSIINNRYIIIQKVGQGGFGAVYKVADTHNGHQVLALKEMSDSSIDQTERPQMVAQFQQEARLLQRFNHPNLPYVTDRFSIGDRHYLVMEFVNGHTLQQLLDAGHGPFPEHVVLNWADQLCDVLGYLHNQKPQVIFRDLKPDNVMVTGDGQVKLIDFGIVRFFKPGKQKDTMALGTPGYAAPEQYSGQTDERSDVYSLGATLFHLLTDKSPSDFSLFTLPKARQINPAISTTMEQVIIRATQQQTTLRFANMASMRAALPGDQPIRPSSTVSPAPTVISSTPGQLSSSNAIKTARPTTRLVAATVKLTAQLTNEQLFAIGAALLAVILVGVWLITPRIQGTWFWFNVPTITLLAPAIFAATRRQWTAGVGHGMVSAVAGALTWYRANVAGDYMALFIGALFSAAAIEFLLYFLPQITAGHKREDPETWKREATWLGCTAVVGHIILTGLTFNFGLALKISSLFFAFVLGGLGWFIGDIIYSAWALKKAP
jgi:serine/threonine protein kinase